MALIQANTGVGSHLLRQGIFPTQRSSLCLPCVSRQILFTAEPRGTFSWLEILRSCVESWRLDSRGLQLSVVLGEDSLQPDCGIRFLASVK